MQLAIAGDLGDDTCCAHNLEQQICLGRDCYTGDCRIDVLQDVGSVLLRNSHRVEIGMNYSESLTDGLLNKLNGGVMRDDVQVELSPFS
ncbi:unnamed protein product [Sphagnum balticum]